MGEWFMGGGAVDRRWQRARPGRRRISPAPVMSELCPRCDRTALSSSGVRRKSFRRLFPSDRLPRRTRWRSVVTSGTVFHSRTVAFASTASDRPLPVRLLRRRGAQCKFCRARCSVAGPRGTCRQEPTYHCRLLIFTQSSSLHAHIC